MSFCTRFIARNNWLSAQIARDYYFASMADSSPASVPVETAPEAANAVAAVEKNEQLQPFEQGDETAENQDRAAG